MEMIYLLFSLGYLTSNIKQLLDEVKKWKSIWNRRMAIFQKDIRCHYSNHYSEMVHFNNIQSNFLMFLEMLSISLVLIIVLACGKTGNFSINAYFMIIVFIMTFIYSEIVFIVISAFPKYNERFFKMLYDWNARNQSKPNRSKKLRFKRMIYLRENIERNLFLQAISRNRYGFYFGQIFFVDKTKLVEMFLFNFVFFTMLYKKIVI